MTFRNDHIFTTGTQNPYVMDSDFIFNTLANMIFYESIEARLQLDEAKKPAVVIDTWNAK